MFSTCTWLCIWVVKGKRFEPALKAQQVMGADEAALLGNFTLWAKQGISIERPFKNAPWGCHISCQVLQTFKPVSCPHKQFSHSLLCRFPWETGHVLQQQILYSLQPHSPGKSVRLRLWLTLHICPLLSKFLVSQYNYYLMCQVQEVSVCLGKE